ncbi:trihelix transcription factor ASIL2-like [Salvia divinorum]|uniref:Trihelix transcription factor ASIL2-like n=1 Tax=Salvia divinorum TaxID=28513 RepID=A0ABD1IDQ8_SALDI
MSSAGDAVTVAVAEAAEKPPRRFPPPCWTQEETLVLIEAYRERWYALRRGYLRTADWDAVAAAVASRCGAGGAAPVKTSAQCRHKIEKLRQRYRAERQRAAAFPQHPGGRYFSSWFFFENMDAMENGTAPPAIVQKHEDSGDGSARLKSLLDQNIVKLKLKSKNSAESGFADGVKPKRFNSGTQIPIDYSEIPEENISHEHDLASYGSRSQPIAAIPKSSFKSRSKNSGKIFNISDGFNHQLFQAKLDNFDSMRNRQSPNGEFWMRVPANHNNNNNISSNKFASAIGGGGAKRSRSAVEEIVASIKTLGEGFVRMENAKMEMAREMEAARMEMEMKRNEMMLESQKQIVDAFLKGLLELKNSKKMKTDPPAADSPQ